MALLGARLLEVPTPDPAAPPTAASTATDAAPVPAAHPPATLLSGLGAIVSSLNDSLSRVLHLAQWWSVGGDLERLAGQVSFALNTDPGAPAMSADEITAVVAAWRAGAISRDTMLERFKRGELLPDARTVAEERALIHRGG